MIQPLIDITGLTKSFRVRGLQRLLRGRPAEVVSVLQGVDLRVGGGQVFGLLGPNGAGKTTLIRILSDLVRADGGEVRLMGRTVGVHPTRHLVGMLTPGERSFFWRLSGYENLRFFAALQGLDRRTADRRSRDLIDRFDLAHAASRRYGTYSAGMKKRLALARALIHEPPILLMDEATDSLDVASRDGLMALVRSWVREGDRCVLWATHRVEEIEAVCDHVGVLVGGRVRFADTRAAFERRIRDTVHTVIEVDPGPCSLDALEVIVEQAGGQIELEARPCLRLPTRAGSDSTQAALNAILAAGAGVVSVQEPTVALTTLFDGLAQEHTDP